MVTRQDFVNDVKSQIPQAYAASGISPTGKNYFDDWAGGTWYSVQKDRWFAQYQAGGWNQHLANSVLLYYNLNSVGYDDFSNKKKVYGDQLRGYVARAQAVYDMAVAEVSMLQTIMASTNDPNYKAAVQSMLTSQIKTANDNAANLKTQKDTLAQAIKNGSAV